MDYETEHAIQRIADVLDPPRYSGPPNSPPRRPPGIFEQGFLVAFTAGLIWAALFLFQTKGWFLGIPLLLWAAGVIHGIRENSLLRQKLLKEWEIWNKWHPHKAKHYD